MLISSAISEDMAKWDSEEGCGAGKRKGGKIVINYNYY